MNKVYNPKEVEEKWYRIWEERRYFHSAPNPDKKPFCIVIPPPNITGILHMGHALNNTLQDILIRWKRMQGYETLWMPGTDHAGIATQNVVERALAKEGCSREDLGRECFIERVWQWQREYGSTIIKQLKRLGCSCDWERTRFTMDEGLSEAVLEVFIRLYNKGLIYQGDYIINWCPRCGSALSDEEVQHKETEGKLYYIRYPIKGHGSAGQRVTGHGSRADVVVATTRPETMLGDVAVAVNPKDRRYKSLKGSTLSLPILGRELKIIEDDFVDPKFGTGAVKVTPAHDPNDFLIAGRHGLEAINVMHPDGRMNEFAGPRYSGKDRFAAREELIAQLKEEGLLERIEPHKYAIGRCYRCETVIEPRLSRQWFVKMKPLAKPAIEAVEKGKIKFHPGRWKKVYLEWMYNIRDWCISRQIWWGHRIPVYYCKRCQGAEKSQIPRPSHRLGAPKSQTNPKSHDPATGWVPRNPKQNLGVFVAKEKPAKCPHCGSTEIEQDSDVLDTWFSSWLWPFSTMGWPVGNRDSSFVSRDSQTKYKFEGPTNHEPRTTNHEPLSLIGYFYPTDVLVTAQEIIFFWVARMIMAGCEFMKDVPFRDVYIHGTVRDPTGAKMSKSLGNIIDPLEIVDEFGADALRFSIISITAQGQDVFLSKDKFLLGRNFANKAWNAARFVLMSWSSHQKDEGEGPLGPSLGERWIISRLQKAIADLTGALARYRFNGAAAAIYDFFWHEYCDWFLELVKEESKSHPRSLRVALNVLETSLRLLHPFMPFITEEIWLRLPHEGESIMVSQWPIAKKELHDAEAEREMDALVPLITSTRNVRADFNIASDKKIKLVMSAGFKLSDDAARYVRHLAGVGEIAFGKRPKGSVTILSGAFEAYVELTGIVDFEKERIRLIKQIEAIRVESKKLEAQLKNKDFLKKAPQDVIENMRKRLEGLNDKSERLEENYRACAA